jgi:hypothetical protein
MTDGVRGHILQAKKEPVNLEDLVNLCRKESLCHCATPTLGEASFIAEPKVKPIHSFALYLTTLSLPRDCEYTASVSRIIMHW